MFERVEAKFWDKGMENPAEVMIFLRFLDQI
jgi:hypothetical protein